jgi:hypothetical protein
MSQEQLIEVVGRAVVDAEFRASLVSEPESAVKEYDLTEEELASLKNIKPEVFGSIGSELEERVSRAGVNLFSSGMPGDFSHQPTQPPPNTSLQKQQSVTQMMREASKKLNEIAENIVRNIGEG